MVWPRWAAWPDGWRLFQHSVSIGAANAKRADARPSRSIPSHPRSKPGIYIKATIGKINPGIGLVKVQTRRQQFVLQCKNGLNEARNTGRCVEVTYVGLEGAYGARMFPVR